MTGAIRWFLSFRFFTTVAMQMKVTVLGYYLYQMTGEPLTLGMLGLYEALPKILTALPAGYLVEQMEKRKALIIVLTSYFFISILLVLSMKFLHADKQILTYSIFLLVFLMGAIGSLGVSGSIALFSTLMPKEQMAKYTAINSNAWQVGAIVGTVLGGYIMKYIGAEHTMIFVILFLLVANISVWQLPKSYSQHAQVFRIDHSIVQIKEGLRFVLENKVMLWAISLDLFAVLFGGCVALLPVFAKDILHVGEEGYGWLRAATPIGSALAMIFLARNPIRKNTGKWLMIFVALFGLATFGFAISKYYYISLFFLFLIGAFDAVSVVIRGAILMLETPDHMRARVSSVNAMFISSSNEIGAFESGFAAQYLGTVRSVIFGSFMTILFVSSAWIKGKELKAYAFEKN